MSSSVQKVSVKSKTHSKSIHSIFRKSILFLNLLVPVPFQILRFFKILSPLLVLCESWTLQLVSNRLIRLN